MILQKKPNTLFCYKSVYGLLKLMSLSELFFRVMNSVCPICKGDASDSDDKVELREKRRAGMRKLVKKEKTA